MPPSWMSRDLDTNMRAADFDYFLPAELIAQHPAKERTASRLLHLDGKTGAMGDHLFRDLPDFIKPGDIMVFNDTRVIKARLSGHKESGGQVEVLVERVLDPHRALAHVRASKAPKTGTALRLADGVLAQVIGRSDDLFELRFAGEAPVFELLERHGQLPLPPYITHAPQSDDEARYQTVYARNPGAVAAPTAGLHFDAAMLETLKSKGAAIVYITLHVGAGTFQPLRDDDISRHVMHSEWYHVSEETVSAIRSAQARGGRVLAVGTTCLRTLEAAGQGGDLQAGSGETKLFITPGYRFRTADRLITNFHLPKSTLLILVSAFAGSENIRRAYRHAIASRYRFFSYGDAMLLERAE